MSDCIFAVTNEDSFDTSSIEVPAAGKSKTKGLKVRLPMPYDIFYYDSNTFNNAIRLSDKISLSGKNFFLLTFRFLIVF